MNKTRIILIVVILLALGTAAYFLFLQPPAAVTPTPGAATTTVVYLPTTDGGTVGTKPEQNGTKSTLSLVLDESIADYWMDESDRTLYHVSPSGAISMTPYNGSAEVAYEGDGRPFVSAQPSAKGDMVIIATGSSVQPTFSLINVITRKRTFLPVATQSATWHPNGKDIVVLRDANGKNPAGLYLLSVAKNTVSLISELSLADVDIHQGPKNSILISQKPTLAMPVSIWIFNLTDRTLKPLTPPMPGIMSMWSAAAQTNTAAAWNNISFSPKQGSGWFAQDGTFKSAGFTTLPTKCTFDASGLKYFCAVPNKTPSNLPDSYLQKKSFTLDSLIEVSTAQGAKPELLWNSQAQGQPFDAYGLRKVGDTLYFINRYDNKLYSLAPVE